RQSARCSSSLVDGSIVVRAIAGVSVKGTVDALVPTWARYLEKITPQRRHSPVCSGWSKWHFWHSILRLTNRTVICARGEGYIGKAGASAPIHPTVSFLSAGCIRFQQPL